MTKSQRMEITDQVPAETEAPSSQFLDERREILNPEAIFERARLAVGVVNNTAADFKIRAKKDLAAGEAPPESGQMVSEVNMLAGKAEQKSKRLCSRVQQILGDKFEDAKNMLRGRDEKKYINKCGRLILSQGPEAITDVVKQLSPRLGSDLVLWLLDYCYNYDDLEKYVVNFSVLDNRVFQRILLDKRLPFSWMFLLKNRQLFSGAPSDSEILLQLARDRDIFSNSEFVGSNGGYIKMFKNLNFELARYLVEKQSNVFSLWGGVMNFDASVFNQELVDLLIQHGLVGFIVSHPKKFDYLSYQQIADLALAHGAMSLLVEEIKRGHYSNLSIDTVWRLVTEGDYRCVFEADNHSSVFEKSITKGTWFMVEAIKRGYADLLVTHWFKYFNCSLQKFVEDVIQAGFGKVAVRVMNVWAHYYNDEFLWPINVQLARNGLIHNKMNSDFLYHEVLTHKDRAVLLSSDQMRLTVDYLLKIGNNNRVRLLEDFCFNRDKLTPELSDIILNLALEHHADDLIKIIYPLGHENRVTHTAAGERKLCLTNTELARLIDASVSNPDNLKGIQEKEKAQSQLDEESEPQIIRDSKRAAFQTRLDHALDNMQVDPNKAWNFLRAFSQNNVLPARYRPRFFELIKQLVAVGSKPETIAEANSLLAKEILNKYKQVVGKNNLQSRFSSDDCREHMKGRIQKLLEQAVNYEEAASQADQEVDILNHYFNDLDTFEGTIFDKYIELYRQSPELTKVFLVELETKMPGLINSGIPTNLRSDPNYLGIVKLVFPAGNYSNYKNNLACGDKLEHLADYKFDHEGYAAQMTGLLGYKLSVVGDGQGGECQQQDDQRLLGDYQARLQKMRDFIASRGPDNEALQRAFEEKLDKIFQERAGEFGMIKNLSLKEKMIAVFLAEALKKSQSKSNYTPDQEILDLVAEYKYAFHENLEDYVQNSASDAARYKDGVSQRYVLWQELSNIYGENLKHVLHHDIFQELEEHGEHAHEISQKFGELVGGKSEAGELKPKQMERFEATFINDRIAEDKKFDALFKQVNNIFGANIKFESGEVQQNFVDELAVALANLKTNFNVNEFKSIVPTLFTIREKYRVNIGAKLEELFSCDINLINGELAKFEEILEEETKETGMNGSEFKIIKKSKKARDVRGYYTKTRETANARMGAYLCIAGDQQMWENKNYFEFVLKDESSGKCVGLTMMLNIEAANGKKYLWFGPNPFESFLAQVSTETCLDFMYKQACQFAENNGFDGVVVPSGDGQILGQCTNRGGNFPDLIKAKRLRDRRGELEIVDFGSKQMLGGGYGYEDGALIWKK